VQTRAVRCVPAASILTDCRLGSQRRLVLFIAWLTLLPAFGPLPQTSQRFAMKIESLYFLADICRTFEVARNQRIIARPPRA
jgi:hypothetical protein